MIMTGTITIYKKDVLEDIDALTYKRVESTMAGQPERVQNSVSSDSKEELDKYLLHRYMQTRDAMLRKKLAFCLVKDTSTEINVSSRLKIDEPAFIYKLTVPEGFDADAASVLASMMHRYLVDGSIYDWYAYQHMDCHVTVDQLDDMERNISRSLRKSYVARPLQPFGPAK